MVANRYVKTLVWRPLFANVTKDGRRTPTMKRSVSKSTLATNKTTLIASTNVRKWMEILLNVYVLLNIPSILMEKPVNHSTPATNQQKVVAVTIVRRMARFTSVNVLMDMNWKKTTTSASSCTHVIVGTMVIVNKLVEGMVTKLYVLVKLQSSL
jgi:hypothetical protein